MTEIGELLERNKQFSKKVGRKLLASLSRGQKPHTAILSCSDSRVIPELIFGCNPGELFVVRVAGNVAGDPCIIASLEYAAEHLGCKNLIILGHTNCGAVSAACKGDGKGNLAKLVSKIRPAVRKAKGQPELAVTENIKIQAKTLLASSNLIRKAVKSRKLNLALALYDVKTGKVASISTLI